MDFLPNLCVILLGRRGLLGGELLAAEEAEEELGPGPLGVPVADLVVERELHNLNYPLVLIPEVVLHLLETFLNYCRFSY